MKVTPVSFCGQKEILEYANRYNPLTKEEREVKSLALKMHEIEASKSGSQYSQQDSLTIKKYLKALKTLTMPSTFGFYVAMDTLSADLLKTDVKLKENIKEITVDIAKNSPEVSRYDLLKLLSFFQNK